MSYALIAVQALGVLAVLAGAAVLLPLGGALVVDGVLVAALGVAAEHIVMRRRSAPSRRRGGPNTMGVE